MVSIKKIGIDCHPGAPRPDTYINGVVEGTALEGKVEEPVSIVFGAWTWHFKVSEEDWNRDQPTMKTRLIKLYNGSLIRGSIISKVQPFKPEDETGNASGLTFRRAGAGDFPEVDNLISLMK